MADRAIAVHVVVLDDGLIEQVVMETLIAAVAGVLVSPQERLSSGFGLGQRAPRSQRQTARGKDTEKLKTAYTRARTSPIGVFP